MNDLIQVSRQDGVTILVIHRPEAMNALNAEVLQALERALVECETDDELRCLVITGAGEKAFVAGADIAQMCGLTASEAAAFASRGHAVFNRIAALGVPVIAAVNGFCLGGGCELSLACDMVYASDRAKFGQPEVKLGLIPGFGGTQRLARRVGAMRALELITTGRMIDAQEAKTIGLCLDVFAADELMGAVMKIAKSIAKRAPVAVRVAKRIQRLGVETSLDDVK